MATTSGVTLPTSSVTATVPGTVQNIYPDSWTNLTNTNTNYAAGMPAWANDVYSNWYSDPLSTGQTSNLTQAYNSLMNPNQAWTDGIQGALGQVNQWQGTQQQANGALQPWDNTIQGALGTAQGAAGTFGQAQSSIQSGSQYDPNQLQQFMNPYTQDAANMVTTMANRNLMENVIPQINSTFTGNGQFGSSRNADFMGRAIRDNQQAIANSLGTLNYGAVKDANANYSDWANKDLAAGQDLINLGSAQTNNANVQANIGSGYGALSGAYNTLGNGVLSSMGALGNLNTAGNNMSTTQAQNQLTAAKDQQALQQAGLDANYKDWTTQQQFPMGALSAVSQSVANMSNGVKPNTYNPSAQPDNITRLLSLLQAGNNGISDPSVQFLINQVLGGE